jgi:predicted TIM-barrel fold metal-dependent hydrolase
MTKTTAEKVIIVSADGHAGMQPDLWPQYLERRYHEHLPALREEAEVFGGSMSLLNDLRLSPETYDVFDKDGRYQSGRWQGLWDAEVREQEMDREGVAAELVYSGDFRAVDLGYNTMNGTYPFDLVDAGVRAYDRWLVDTFGHSPERFLLVGPTGTYADMDAALEEAVWAADHGFTGTFAPGFTHFPGMRPLDDEFWEPLWSLYEERGLALVVHGGYGFDQGFAYGAVKAAKAEVDAQGGGVLDLAGALSASLFNSDFFSDLRCRRAMWQLLLGGVFDRHPRLRLMMVEVRADWIPATLRRLDAAYLEHRDDVPAERPPSECWATSCLAGLSFMHKSEVEMRDEIGVETIDFGRDYPHTEGTWPNTMDYLRGLFAGVPERDVRLILGENAIRFLGLDREPLAAIAGRVGPSIDDIVGGSDMDPALEQHLDDRSGYLKPAEGDSRLADIEGMLDEDLSRLAKVG